MTNAQASAHLDGIFQTLQHAQGLTFGQSVKIHNSFKALADHFAAPAESTAPAAPPKSRAKPKAAPDGPQTPAAS